MFKPTSSHRVCGDHFVGGKRSKTHNVPTLFPTKNATTSARNTSTSRKAHLHALSAELEKNLHGELDKNDDLELDEFEDTVPNIDNVACNVCVKTTVSNDCDHNYSCPPVNEPRGSCTPTKKTRTPADSPIKKIHSPAYSPTKNLPSLKFKTELSRMKATCSLLRSKVITVSTLRKSTANIKMYTGLQSYRQFSKLFNLIQPDIPYLIFPPGGSNTFHICPEDCLLLVLCRFKSAATQSDLAFRLVRQNCFLSTLPP